MVEIKQYHLFPTDLIPNSPRPLLHYKNVIPKVPHKSHCSPAQVWERFTHNGWDVQWIFRYGPTQLSHFHSKAHECMAVLSGTARIRFGVAHKTYNTKPEAELKLLSPGRAHGIEADDPKEALSKVELSGYTMLGAYCGGKWDFVVGGGDYEKCWAVPKPKYDPVFRDSDKGLCKTWRGSGGSPSLYEVRL